ncbi:MAG: hypothetical protein R3194_10840, partial [Limnobacter sp.]|nr:hypothetical protein [Limnobacter sp.]
MNDLQITLLVVGGGGIIAMIAYNWWQDYKVRRQATERFGANESDPLFSDIKAEPSMGMPQAQDEPVGDAVIENEVETEHHAHLFADFIIQFDTPLHDSNIKPLIDTLTQSHAKKVVISVSPTALTEENPETIWFKAANYQGDLSALRVSPQLAN